MLSSGPSLRSPTRPSYILISKKCAPSQSSNKSTAVAPRTHTTRKNDVLSVSTTNQSVKVARPTSSGEHIIVQITELKLAVDGLEKERDFYFAKLRDIEILCQSPETENVPVVEAILRILYATDDDASVVAEAKAIISKQKIQRDALSPIYEVLEDKTNVDTQKRKNAINVDVDEAATNKLYPRQRVSDASDVHCSGSPLMTY